MQNKETAKIALARSKEGLIVQLSIVAIIVIFLSIVVLWLYSILQENPKTITVGKESFTVEVADTEAEREKGLGERDGLGQNTGMLFDFKENKKWKIWMLNMRFPIDIIWLDANGKIVHIKKNATPDSFPNVFIPETPATYVVELNSGAIDKTGVKLGDSVRL